MKMIWEEWGGVSGSRLFLLLCFFPYKLNRPNPLIWLLHYFDNRFRLIDSGTAGSDRFGFAALDASYVLSHAAMASVLEIMGVVLLSER